VPKRVLLAGPWSEDAADEICGAFPDAEVMFSLDFDETIGLVEAFEFDIIVTDATLLGGDGKQLLEHLRKQKWRGQAFVIHSNSTCYVHGENGVMAWHIPRSTAAHFPFASYLSSPAGVVTEMAKL
jgi:hypothetical protein